MASRSSERAFPVSVSQLVSAVVVAGVIVLVVAANRHGDRSARFRVDPTVVSVQQLPAWLPPDLAEALATSLASQLPPASLRHEDDLEIWEEDLPDLAAWIAAVESVEPRFPGQADVRLRLRRPVVVLAGDLLVAADGQRVGVGVLDRGPRPLDVQGRPDGEDVLECAAAADELLPFREELAAQGIEVDRVEVEGLDRVVFLTDRGVELEWGRSARKSEFAAVDLPAGSRVANLLEVVRRRPGLAGVRRIVLWKDRPDVILEG